MTEPGQRRRNVWRAEARPEGVTPASQPQSVGYCPRLFSLLPRDGKATVQRLRRTRRQVDVAGDIAWTRRNDRFRDLAFPEIAAHGAVDRGVGSTHI